MTATEMGAAMGTFVDSRVNFVTGSAMMEQNRAELYVDDQVGQQQQSPLVLLLYQRTTTAPIGLPGI